VVHQLGEHWLEGGPLSSAGEERVGGQRDDPFEGGHDQQELAAHAVGGQDPGGAVVSAKSWPWCATHQRWPQAKPRPVGVWAWVLGRVL
jgi:hypothetical protein